MSKYIKFYCTTGYKNHIIDVMEFPEKCNEEEINHKVLNKALDYAYKTADSYFGIYTTYTPEEYKRYIDNNLKYHWNYISKEEFEENIYNFSFPILD